MEVVSQAPSEAHVRESQLQHYCLVLVLLLLSGSSREAWR